MERPDLAAIAAEVLTVIARGGPDDEARFDDLVRRVHAAQCAAIPQLGRLAAQKGRGPGEVDGWRTLPAVPSGAYKRYDLFAGALPAARTFTSSGTSGATPSRAHYSSQGLALMDAAIDSNARRMLFPDERRPRVLVMAPPAAVAPQMIMVYGMDRLIGRFGGEGSRFLVGPGGLDLPAVVTELERAAADNVPVGLFGASFGMVHLLEAMDARGTRITLPPGSRTLDAGGFKGRSRDVSREELRDWIASRLGVGPDWQVNLLGMTELPSQIYDDGIAARAEGRAALRGKRPPPWLRPTVRAPLSLTPGPPPVPGRLPPTGPPTTISPLALLTDDMGVPHADGSLSILGRARGAEARGCSLSVDEWVRVQEAR